MAKLEDHSSTVIISSTQDPASTNMKSCLLDESSWEEGATFFNEVTYKHSHFEQVYMVTISDKTILHEHLEEELLDHLQLRPSRLIFISRHRSKTGEPTLTTHPIGNYGVAEFGGKSSTLTPSLPYEMARLLRSIHVKAKEANLQHHVCYEVTHHGPYLQIPTLFAEVGSDEREWQNMDACRVVALSVLELLEQLPQQHDDIALVGIGGGHYAPRFTEICLQKHAAFGHMMPSHHIKSESIDKEMIKKTLEATPGVQAIYIHRKALKKSEVSILKGLCEEINIPVVSSNDLPDL